MVKKEKKSPRGDKRRKDAPALIAELFRSLPDKRYSVKSLMAAVGATTRDEKERVRGIVRDLAAEGVIEQVSEGKYRLSHSERETVEGTVDMTSSGALYVIVEGMDKDIYVNASRTSHALHGDRVRVRRFYRVSVCVEAALIAVLGTVCFLFPSQIVGLFSDNGEVIAAGARYTGTMAYLYLFAYMGEVIQGFFRGLGRLRLTMLASLLQVVLRVVLSYFLIPVWGMYGICVAVASGWVLLVLIEGSYSVRTARALTMEKRED